jgi:hypothetical protein
MTPDYLFSINKVRINDLVISHHCGFTTIFFPCHHSFGYSLSHQFSNFRWSTQGIVSPPTMLKTLGKKQPRSQPAATPSAYSLASVGYASTDASDHAAHPGQPAYTTPSATTVEG